MKEFLFVFRNDYKAMAANTSPEVMQGMMKKWMDWMYCCSKQIGQPRKQIEQRREGIKTERRDNRWALHGNQGIDWWLYCCKSRFL